MNKVTMKEILKKKAIDSTTKGKIQNYISRIKNVPKKEYAKKYFDWILKGEIGRCPDKGSLSAMGAQAVEMNISDLMEGK